MESRTGINMDGILPVTEIIQLPIVFRLRLLIQRIFKAKPRKQFCPFPVFGILKFSPGFIIFVIELPRNPPVV